MLNNLRNVYLREENYRGQIGVLDLMLAARPLAAEQYKHRAVCHLAEKHYDSALRDFRTYLELAPEAADRAAVAEQAERIERYLAAPY
jgi:regulator of sirC expression with transglutaminase-like and TPR domain